MKRRDFIKGLILGTTGLFSGLIKAEDIINESKKPSLFIVKNDDIEKAVKKSIELLGGIKKFVKEGDRVLIKPNISFGNPPEWGSTTHPAVIKTVAELCLEAGARKIIIADYPLRNPDICLEKTGIKDAVSSLDRTVVFMATERKFYEEMKSPEGKQLKSVEVSKEYKKADVFINIPTAKSHSASGVSFGLKNLMGLIWDREYFHEDIDLHQGIADLACILRPHLTIMDAVYVLKTRGPGGPGDVEQMNTIIAGTDPVAVDSYTVSLTDWYGHKFTGEKVKHILFAYQHNLGEIDISKINIVKAV